MKKITINIEGLPQSGKSTIIQILSSALCRYGILHELDLFSNVSYEGMKDLDKRIESVRDELVVDIIEITKKSEDL